MAWRRTQWVEMLATVGVACLVAGLLRYSIQEQLLLAAEILLIAGGVLVLAAIVLGFGGIVRFFSKRSSQLGTNAVILSIGVVVILGLLNFLGYEHHKRFDLTSEKLYTLSNQTQKIVRGLQQDVNIVRFAKQRNQAVDDLLAEYRHLSSRIKFQDVDPDAKPEIAKEYGATQMNQIVVASGPRKQQLEPNFQGAFAEQDLTSAILKVSSDKEKEVCFVIGHGEKSLSDDGAHGYSQVGQELKRENYATDSINLVQSNGVPSRCNVLVIAGPVRSFFPQETAMVSKYLDDGGKVLVEVDPLTQDKQSESDLEPIFEKWNIDVGRNLVIDASGMGRLLGAGPAIPLVVDYGSSPITNDLERTMSFFPLARTVSIADKSKSDPQSVELLKTSGRSFTTPRLEREVRYDPKTDTMGPLSLGVAASNNATEKGARLVVFGDSDFASNEAVGQASNGDLFLNAVDWLAQDENLISIRPKKVTNRSVNLTAGGAIALRWLDIFGLPGMVIIVGIVIWWKRR
ncbi:MAG TPA: GldG family protein [Nitrospira sp.]|nr:GldG family protein [Nitrospira sp.]